MEWFDSGWGLSLTVFLPLVGAVIMMVIPRTSEAALKWVALLTSLVTLALSGVLVARFDFDAAAEFQFGTDLDWIPLINANYHIGVDGISLPLVVLATLITALVVI
ncbi:MAG: NADH-quinone oxidoreductase subunit M, partial [Actinomycetota bacterium]|nr:NADH-quinone oxidoreductase subunit M [Actinomycetota bacterium]